MGLRQTDCFKINMKFWKYLGIWPKENRGRYYDYYSSLLITTFVFVYEFLFTINFYFLPKQLDLFIEEMRFYFTVLAVLSKVLTFIVMRYKIIELLNTLESEIFQPDDAEGIAIIEKAKQFNVFYWKIVAGTSIISSVTHLMSPLLLHLLKSVDLVFPVCSYSFLPDDIKNNFIYPIYIYQSLGIHCQMYINVNIDTFILGLMVCAIAQLDILDIKLREVTDYNGTEKENYSSELERNAISKINKCIIHYGEVAKFCSLFEDIFSGCLFVQFSMSSCIICVCLFKLTMPAPLPYYIFLGSYLFLMIIQILVPCWFGSKIMDKSNLLSFATYNCDWTSRSRQFKSNLRLFVERANKPLSLTGGKMFCLSLNTFTSIMNSAYSIFTLLQHMQSRE